MLFRDHDEPIRDMRTLLLEMTDVEDEGEEGVHRWGRRIVIEHDLGDTYEKWPTVTEARATFLEAVRDAHYWATGHVYECECRECDPDGWRDRAAGL